MKYQSTTIYILKALIPFTEENLKLSFKPGLFFADIAKNRNISEKAVRSSLRRAVSSGLVEYNENGIPKLTNQGERVLRPFRAKHLKWSKLMVIFDIPEPDRWKRRQLRAILNEFKFRQVQKSVWISSYDSRTFLKKELKTLNLGKEVKIFEAFEI